MKHVLTLFIAGFSAAAACSQTTFFVNGECGEDSWTGLSDVCAPPGGPKRTIQAAINAVGANARIRVAPGVYAENLSIVTIGNPNRRLTLESTNGAATTILDGQGSGNAIFANEIALGGLPQLTVRGFSIRNADTGLVVGPRLPTSIAECVFSACAVGVRGSYSFNAADCEFRENGVAVQLSGNEFEVGDFDRCVFRTNAGEAIVAPQRSSVVVKNSIVAFNGAGDQPAIVGFAVRLHNVTLTENPGLAVELMSSDPGVSTLQMYNCAVWSNNGGGEQIRVHHAPPRPPPSVTVEYSIVQGGFAGGGNIDADPLFVDPTPTGFDFRVRPGSPTIDAGSNERIEGTLDLAQRPRRMNDPDTIDTGLRSAPIVDMGAFEFREFVCRADLDGSGAVGVGDLAILLASFGALEATPQQGDLDGDLDIDLRDLARLLGVFGGLCP